MSATPTIVTEYVYPPIPDRQFDWCAFYDDDREWGSPTGWGATKLEAVTDLIDNHPRPDVYRKSPEPSKGDQ